MTAAMVAAGALLWTRHRLATREGPLRPVAEAEARRAGRALQVICAVSALLVLGIVALQWRRGGELGAFSLALPLLGLVWLATLAAQSRKHRDAAPPPVGDRPSRRPAKLEGVPAASQRPSQPPTDRRVSA